MSRLPQSLRPCLAISKLTIFVFTVFQIYIYGNETKFDHQIQINSSLDSIYVHGMIKDMNYKIQMSAWNKMGEGLRSEAIQIGE